MFVVHSDVDLSTVINTPDLTKPLPIISAESIHDVNKVTSDVVQKVVLSMKARKSDITSDALLNSPDIMFEHLATIF